MELSIHIIPVKRKILYILTALLFLLDSASGIADNLYRPPAFKDVSGLSTRFDILCKSFPYHLEIKRSGHFQLNLDTHIKTKIDKWCCSAC